MRLYLLPISTRRTLLYAQRFSKVISNSNGNSSSSTNSQAPSASTTTTTATTTHTTAALADDDSSYVDKGANWAAKKWAQWEKRESGWQRKVVDYGNYAFRRIPYEEWGLKSVPPRRSDRREEVELCFPESVIAKTRALDIVKTLATERHALHKKRLIWCFVGMPISAPFALVPLIPNLPFFYLVYRAWSHWRAIAGGKHIQWLGENNLIVPTPSKTLHQLYSKHIPKVDMLSDKEQMLLTQKEIQSFSEELAIPALEIELERAIWQVEQSLKEPTVKDDSKEGAKPAQSGEEKKER